ncbi:DDE superfamily endonuclease [Phanerochaete sordida]|uniref:DDE superfamily endonuclease n=1 Tax=Phanerochaete sordida TaxID=48140 RepID=A0A9P3GY32_9APHY|nr:DDE superfamily endonuclease [Phanerochaete sordida]
MQFCYVLSGWEGSASDNLIFESALTTSLKIPDKYFFLADAGFPSCKTLLVPYRGVRYHLREWGVAGQRPQDCKELFNLRHSQLRNVIERIFGSAKNKLPVMGRSAPYSLEAQAAFFPAFAAIYNFNRIHNPDDTNDSIFDSTESLLISDTQASSSQ